MKALTAILFAELLAFFVGYGFGRMDEALKRLADDLRRQRESRL